jgi:hypothetical protein
MTRRRRLGRRLLWAGVLLGLVLLLAVVSVLRASGWVGRHLSNVGSIRKEKAMKARTALVVVVVALSAITVGAGATLAGGDEQWRTALQQRSEALNRMHGLGPYGRTPAATDRPPWLAALIVRSEALNREYGLGKYARKSAAAKRPAWHTALIVRSEALNKRHKLGAYAPGS